jgi:pimeloyl-ACP methyl ester carboxylesterase
MLPVRLPVTIDTRRLRSFDGTEIAYHVTPAPYPGAPWIVLANGLGGGTLVWRGQIDYLRDRYRFVSWDYRGLYGSERPRPDRADGYAVSAHAKDLMAVLAAERIEQAGFVAWSLGVQVVLEAFTALGDRARSLVLVNGCWGHPLDGLTPVPGLRATILPFLDLFRRARSFGAASHRLIGGRDAARWLRRLGVVGRSADDAALAELAASVGTLDLDAFLRNLRAFGAHDADTALAAIAVPVLVIAGERDPLIPRVTAQQMARRIRRAELDVVRDGAHCAPIEYPELIALRIERFYREHGL